MSPFDEVKVGPGTALLYSPDSAKGSCPRCGAAWSFENGSWLWNERSGATHLLKEYGKLDDEGQPPPLKRCPCCRWKLGAGLADHGERQ